MQFILMLIKHFFLNCSIIYLTNARCSLNCTVIRLSIFIFLALFDLLKTLMFLFSYVLWWSILIWFYLFWREKILMQTKNFYQFSNFFILFKVFKQHWKLINLNISLYVFRKIKRNKVNNTGQQDLFLRHE